MAIPSRSKRAARRAGSRRRRKTLELDQQLIDDARDVLGCQTETETVRRALEDVVARKRIADGIRWLGGRKLFNRRKVED